MPDIELRLIANNDQYISGIKEAQTAQQSLNDNFKAGEKDKQTLIDKTTDIFGKSTTERAKAYAELNKDLKKFQNELEKLNEKSDAFAKAGKKIPDTVTDRVKKVQEFIINIKDDLSKFDKSTDQSTARVRTQITQLKDEMAKLALSGKQNSKEFNELAEKAGKLHEELTQANKVVNEFSSSTGKALEGVVRMGEGMMGAFATAQGATSLFTDSEEQASEATKRMTASIEVLVGIQSVMNVLNKDSEAIMLVLNLQRKAAILYTNLETAAQSKNIVVKYSAIIAQKILNAVMTANPVMLLVTGMLALGVALMIFAQKARTAAQQLKVLNQVESDLLEIDEIRRENLKRENDDRLSAFQDREKIAKAEGVSQLELLNLEIETAKIRRENASKLQSDYNSTNQNIQKIIEKLVKQRALYDELIFSPENASLKQAAENKKLAEQLKVQIELNQNKLTGMLAANKEFADADLELDIKKLEKIRLLKEEELANNKAILESKLSKTKEESKLELDTKIKLLENEKEKELLNVNLTEIQKQAIRDKYARQESDMRKVFIEQQKRNELEGITALAQASLSATMEGTQENHLAKLALIETEYNAQKYNLEISIKDEKLKNDSLLALNAKYLADKKAQNTAFALQELDFNNSQAQGIEEINKIKAQEVIANNHSSIFQVLAATKEIEDIQQQALDREIALNEQKHNEKLINEEAYQSQLTKLKIDGENLRLAKIQKNAQDEKAAIDFVKQQVISSVTEIISQYAAQADAKVQMIDKQLNDSKNQLDKELELQKNGYANNVDAKRAEIAQLKIEKEKALEEEKKAQQAQLLLDSAQQLSSMVTGVANIWKMATLLGPIIGPIVAIATTALMFGAFAAAKIKANQAINAKAELGLYGDDSGVIVGKRHSQGGEKVKIEAEGGEAYAIWNRQATQKYGKFIPQLVDSMNSLKFQPYFKMNGNQTVVNIDTKKMQSELETISSGIRILNENMSRQTDSFYNGKTKIIKLSNNHTRIIHAKN